MKRKVVYLCWNGATKSQTYGLTQTYMNRVCVGLDRSWRLIIYSQPQGLAGDCSTAHL